MQTRAGILSDGASGPYSSTHSLFKSMQAMERANMTDPSKCYFIDDNRKNVDAAQVLNWGHCVHFCEKGLEAMEGGRIKEIDDAREPGSLDNDVTQVQTLEDLRKVWPEIFKDHLQ